MALFEYNFDSDVLRAISYARLQIASGKGLESVIHSMASASLGLVSENLQVPIAKMKAGEDTRLVLQHEVERVPNKAYAELLTSLLVEGHAAIVRMDELSEDIQLERRIKIENYGKSLGTMLTFGAMLFMATFIPIFVRVIERIPENNFMPAPHIPPTFYTVFYAGCTLAMTLLLNFMRYRE